MAMNPAAAPGAPAGATPAGHEARLPMSTHWTLLLLLFVYTMSFTDRQVIGILVEPIKREFQVSDTAMGLLTGLTFALFYSLLGIPFARYAALSLVALSLTSAVLVGCGGSKSEPTTETTTETTTTTTPEPAAGAADPTAAPATEESGEAATAALFKTRCALCHGPDGHGNGPGAAALKPAPRIEYVERQPSLEEIFLALTAKDPS